MDLTLVIAIVPHSRAGYLVKAGWYTQKPWGFELVTPFTPVAHPPDFLTGLLNQLSPEKLKSTFGYHEPSFEHFLNGREPKDLQERILPILYKLQSRVVLEALRNQMPVMAVKNTGKLAYSRQVEVIQSDLELAIELKRGSEEILYFLRASALGMPFPLTSAGHQVLRWSEPLMLLNDKTLYIFGQPREGKIIQPFLEKEFLRIPLRAQELYYRKFLRRAAAEARVIGDGFRTVDLHPLPQARLTAEMGWNGTYGLSLSFAYDEKQLRANDPLITLTSLTLAGNELLVTRFHRNTEQEKAYQKILEDLELNVHGAWLPFTAESQRKSLSLLLDFLSNNKELLEKQGFIIETRLDHKYYLQTPHLHTEFKFHNDWFDLYLVIRVGEMEFPFTALKDHILEGNPDFELPNGQVFRIPESWFAQYSPLFSHANAKDNRVRLHKTQRALLEWAELPLEISGLKSDYDLPEELPQLNSAHLRTYQVEGYHWLVQHWKNGTGALLADDMGLGKTLQIIALLKTIYSRYSHQSIHNKPEGARQLSLFEDKQESEISTRPWYPPSLVVVPASILHNWAAELKHFTPELPFALYSGADRSPSCFTHFPLVLTTYGIMRNDIELLESIELGCVILDESQNIKNPDSRNAQYACRLQARHRFCLSGTPIENRPEELWSQMHFLNPDLLGSLSHFKKYFSDVDINAEARELLRRLTTPYILRRNKQEVLQELPPLNEITLLCDMLPEQALIYEQEKSKQRNQLLKLETLHTQSRVHVLNALMRLRLLAIEPGIFREFADIHGGKTQAITSTLETLTAEGHKVLVFSSFVRHLKILSQWCTDQGIKHQMLTGQTRNRPQVIESFRKDPDMQIFLISLKAGGVGLNLTEADYVLITDPWWNVSAERQAMDRAHRIGQNRPVFVYRFITRQSVEEKMENIKARKIKMAAGLLDDAAMMREMLEISWEEWISSD
ncbi:MAG: DEAD/DEAH box helicase [Bacteroidales bacterium]